MMLTQQCATQLVLGMLNQPAVLVEDVLIAKLKVSLVIPQCLMINGLTPIFAKSSASSASLAIAMGGAAGNPTYFAIPDNMETSLLYAIWFITCCDRCVGNFKV